MGKILLQVLEKLNIAIHAHKPAERFGKICVQQKNRIADRSTHIHEADLSSCGSPRQVSEFQQRRIQVLETATEDRVSKTVVDQYCAAMDARAYGASATVQSLLPKSLPSPVQRNAAHGSVKSNINTYPAPTEKLILTIEGIERCAGSGEDIENFLITLKLLVRWTDRSDL